MWQLCTPNHLSLSGFGPYLWADQSRQWKIAGVIKLDFLGQEVGGWRTVLILQVNKENP